MLEGEAKVSVHTVDSVLIAFKDEIPWWAKCLPHSWRMSFLKGRPLRGEMLMRCNGERHWRKVAWDAGRLGGVKDTRVSCPVCGEMLPMQIGG
jgi:hypothetical protein